MHVREPGPRDGNHLGGRVELHRARTERNHGPVEREVLVGERTDVTQELGLRAIEPEHGLREKTGAALQCFGNAVRRARVRRGTAERFEHRLHVIIGDRFVYGQCERIGAEHAKVVTGRIRRRVDSGRLRARAHDERVEETLRRHVEPMPPQARDEGARFTMHGGCDRVEPVTAVIDRIEARDDGRENLRRADVARRLLAPDVLFACLQREAIRAPAFGIDRCSRRCGPASCA